MSTSIALMSGKGGSGKTSLALTIASILSECDIKVLMIDCDMATNGATYFFETKLNESTDSLDSIESILQECISPSGRKTAVSMTVKENFEFFPSITTAKLGGLDYYSLSDENIVYFRNVLQQITNQFDVVLFDFQAGYSDLMHLLLPLIDVSLFVIEPDAVSASSLRSLYLKIGNDLDNKKVYQVFNKASEEEYKIYSKLYSGTLFPTIDTIRFDWEIRKAFSLAKIPSIENCSYPYLKQIIDLSLQLIFDIALQEKLVRYKDKVELKIIDTRSADIRSEIRQLTFKLEKEKYLRIEKKNGKFPNWISKFFSNYEDTFFYSVLSLIIAIVVIQTIPFNNFQLKIPIYVIEILTCVTILMTGVLFFVLKKKQYPDINALNDELKLDLLRNELESLSLEKKNLIKKSDTIS